MLVLHRSERADNLIDALGDLIEAPLNDPVQAEVVSVPTRGVERWLTQRLSHRLGSRGAEGAGVCANLRFPFPGGLVRAVTAQACGIDPDADPWQPEQAVWPLIEVIDAGSDDPALGPLISHLRASTPAPASRSSTREPFRFGTARHLADLFARYGSERPDMVVQWFNAPGGEALHWQGALWRRLRARIGVESPAERLAPAAERLAAEPGIVDLPERLSVFGLTRLPVAHLAVLQALAVARDVHLFILHPSGVLWDRLSGPARVFGTGPRPSRGSDPTERLPDNPLLRSWGRDAREMQIVLSVAGGAADDYRPVAGAGPGASLLARIQGDIRADRPPGRPAPFEPGDRSLTVHSCHGRSRQVQVMRDAVLHLLDEDPTLEPRDVIVMCPDIEAFAPLIHAAFGPPSGADGREPGVDLRVRLADRALRQTNPLLGVAAELLVLADARITASEVLDLLSRPPVARRFRVDADDLSAIEGWVGSGAVRWGLDSAHRARWNLRLADNTWQFGLDRLALGVAMSGAPARTFRGTLPLDDVASTDLELAGRFAEFLHRLAAAVAALTGPQAVGAWADALAVATASLAEGEQPWESEQLRTALSEAADGAPRQTELALEEVRTLLSARLAGAPTRANFRTGELTICTLVPMRSVPHRVVGLLGLDDGAFPRQPAADGDNLLLADPRVGDRDARSEDRQLLLDALLAATDHLIITYSGADERTNRPRPPCVPVAELLDVVDATVSLPDGRPGREAVVARHPLQPFDARNFTAGALPCRGPWSYDGDFLDGARALGRQAAEPSWLPAPLPDPGDPVVQLDYLLSFLQHPVQGFLRRRLGIFLTDRQDDILDAVPIELDELEKWGVGERLLEARLAGTGIDDAVTAERARGLLPPGALAESVLDRVVPVVEELVTALDGRGLLTVPAAAEDVRVDLPDGRTLIGLVPNVRRSTIVGCTYSRVAAKHRLAAWVRLLALSAHQPDIPVRAVTLGRGQGQSPVAAVALQPLASDAGGRRARAVAGLTALVDLYDRGLRAPLPLPCKSAHAWAEARSRSGDADQAWTRAAAEWNGSKFNGERADGNHEFVYGRGAPFSVVADEPAGPAESGPGWHDGEGSRFGRLARYLWEPVLAHERASR